MRRAASLTRVSSDEQANPKKTSLAKQAEINAAMAEQHSWKVVATYEEPGVSGALDLEERDEVQRLLKDAQAGHFEVVIFFHPDRLGRDLFESLALAKKLDRLGVAIAFSEERRIVENVTEDDMEALMFFLRAWKAQGDYRGLVSKLQTGRFDAARQNGTWPSGRIPHGYRQSDDRRSLVINDDEAPAVRMAFEMRAAGHAVTVIVQALADAGYKARPSKRKALGGEAVRSALTRATVTEWFKKPYYKGEPITRKMRRTKDAERQTFFIPTEAIVDPDLWERANQAKPVGRKKGSRNSKRRTYSLSQRIVHVHPDGSPHVMHGIPSNGRRLYGCTAGRRNTATGADPIGCPGFGNIQKNHPTTRISADRMEARFLYWALELLDDPEALQQYAKEADAKLAAMTPDADPEALEEQAVRLQTKRDRWAELYAEGEIDRDTYDRRVAEVDTEAEAVQRLIDEVQGIAESRAELGLTIKELLSAEIAEEGDSSGGEFDYDNTPPRGSAQWRGEIIEAIKASVTRAPYIRVRPLPGWVIEEAQHLANALGVIIEVEAGTEDDLPPWDADGNPALWPRWTAEFDPTLRRVSNRYGLHG